jgi:hypothetical protein
MELSKYAQAIKNELAMELEKVGSSLEELETSLQNINNGEAVYKIASTVGAILKKAAAPDGGMTKNLNIGGITGTALGSLAGAAGGGMLGGVAGVPVGAMLGGTAGGVIAGSLGSALREAPELAFKGSLAGGALAGLSLDEMDKSVEGVNKALEREREKVNLVRRITANLKREHGLT